MVDTAVFALGLAGVILALIAYTNIFKVQVQRINLAFSKLPENFEGFSILHLTDMHTNKWGRMEDKLQAILNNHPVDVVVFTGDLASSRPGLDAFKRILRNTRGKDGTYIAFGNTEFKHWEREVVTEAFESEGAKVLRNSSIAIERDGQYIQIVGVDDPFTGHSRIGKALTDVPNDRFKILLAHSPQIADDALHNGISLMLSGHTHGGQVRLPFIGAVKTHVPRFRKLSMGLFEGEKLTQILGEEADSLKVYVSRGVGTSYAPVRFLCPPEIPLYILHRA